MRKVNVEAQEVEVIHCFQFDGIAEEVVVDQGLDGRMGEDMFVVYNEAVVYVAVVYEVEICVVEKVVV